jgi:hypothetical protein
MAFPNLRIGLSGLIKMGEIVVWEKDDDFCNGLPLDWAMDGFHDEDALEEENSSGQDDCTPEDKRQEGALEFEKLHQLWRC